jgi:hypothetical protein
MLGGVGLSGTASEGSGEIVQHHGARNLVLRTVALRAVFSRIALE